jgi:GAF domain-containing protein
VRLRATLRPAGRAADTAVQPREDLSMTENLVDLHRELAGVVLVGRDLPEVLTEVVRIARRAIPGSDATSITLIRDDKGFTAAYDGQIAMDADELQYERGYGPCLDAGRAGELFVVHDMRTEERWPDYARHAAERGVGSSLSVPLPFQGATIGALNNYAGRPNAFAEDDVRLGEEVAAFVAIAVGNAEAAARATTDVANMRQAMVSRSVIEQAKGILMERYKITPEQAFTLLTHASQRSNVKLRDIADELATTGVLRGS